MESVRIAKNFVILLSTRYYWDCRTLWRPLRSWEDNIKIDLRGIVCEDVNWFHADQDNYQWWLW
jgi:hypothetical protein